jgi:uncharacterized hydantoinase/oxoprolinase family protein
MNEIQQSQNFEQKMMERIKDSIGDLITDEELKRLINTGMDRAFLQKKTVSDGYRTKEMPSFLEEVVKELLEEKVHDAISVYIKEHADEVLNVVDKVVQTGLGNAMLNAINMQFQSQMYQFQSNIQHQLNQR